MATRLAITVVSAVGQNAQEVIAASAIHAI